MGWCCVTVVQLMRPLIRLHDASVTLACRHSFSPIKVRTTLEPTDVAGRFYLLPDESLPAMRCAPS
jgi:hypothetical protein